MFALDTFAAQISRSGEGQVFDSVMREQHATAGVPFTF
jgi:hypothetical protein